jgi:hypothetical protein
VLDKKSRLTSRRSGYSQIQVQPYLGFTEQGANSTTIPVYVCGGSGQGGREVHQRVQIVGSLMFRGVAAVVGEARNEA